VDNERLPHYCRLHAHIPIAQVQYIETSPTSLMTFWILVQILWKNCINCHEQSVKREKTNKMQHLDVYHQLLSQYVSGIIMPIFGRSKNVLLRMVSVCGW